MRKVIEYNKDLNIEVTFLGTGTSQGVPMIGCCCEVCLSNDKRDKRLRSSVLITVGDMSLVIDTTPDFRYQMLRAGQLRLDGVLYTHEHKDHTGGMDDIRAYNYIMRQPIALYCEERVGEVLHKDFDYAFAQHRYPGVPDVNIITIDEAPFEIKGVKIEPIRGMHYKLPVLGYRIGGFCYLTDMNYIAESEILKLKGVDTLVINALRREPHISHFTLDQALQVIEQIEPRQAYLTHMSHQIGRYEELIKILPPNVMPAVDKLKIKITTLESH